MNMAETHEDPGSSRVNILLVDDNRANLLALRAVLEGLGQNLLEARSGDEALRLLLDQDFAVVLLDVEMQGLDGFETARLMRSRDRSRQTPIIFVTAHDEHLLLAEKAYDLGAVDYLIKPVVPQVLRAKVTVFVELFQKSRQIQEQGERLRELEREKAAREEARKAAILDNSLDGIVTLDQHGCILEFNPAAERIFGYRRAELQGRNMADFLIPQRLRDQYRQGLATYLGGGDGPALNRRLEMPALTGDGREIPVELAIIRIPMDGPPLFTGFVRDISDRHRTEQRRATQLAVTQVLADAPTAANALTGILRAVGECLHWSAGSIWTVDPHDQVLRCMEFWHTEEVQVPRFEAMTRQKALARGVGLPGQVWASGQPVWIRDVALDGNFPRAPVAAQEGLHGAFAFPILLERQTVGVIEFFSQSIQKPDEDLLALMATVGIHVGQFLGRKRVEEEARASEQRFARFTQNLPGLAWIKDLEGRYVYVNDAAEKAFGTTRSRLYGKSDAEVFPPETAAQFRENDQRATQSEAGVQTVESLLNPDGIMHHSLVSKFPILGPEGKPVLIGGMAIDITDRMRLEEELLQANRRKDEFLATLAHELRNPLAPIRNSLHLLRLAGAGEPANVQILEMMERQVKHMVRLVDDLLEVSRITRGKIELRKERIELAAVLRSAVETARPLLERGRHQLAISLPPEPLLLEADGVRLAQVLANLLNNAAKYTEEGGQIWLNARPEADQVVLTVRDTGVGIPAEMLPRVFEMFTQVDRTLGRAQGGLGIGLTLVKRLVEMHGGTVEARSEGLGRGCEFLVRLPLAGSSSGLAALPSTDPTLEVLALRRILVVDDNRDAADSLGMLLRFQGAEVQVAYDGPSALSALTAFQPAIMLLDIGMPSMDGYEVARRVRQQAECKDVTIIALTGWGQDEDRRKSAAAGFDAHLVKPVDHTVLMRLLAEVPKARS